MSPMLPGFSLKLKKWLYFYIDNIRLVSWNEEAYNHLVLPENTKGLLQTFVGKHGQSRANYPDEVVGGKGQGLIILLDGPPGNGKTLAAEAVADKTRLTLMYLHAEDLGTESSQIGLRLSRALELATEWNVVILLDEADTFLARRSLESAPRNEIVAAMFRHLEYYQGIIFLTTNLLGSIDEAFLSRTNLQIRFPALSAASGRAIWSNFLGRLRFFGPSSMDDDPGTQPIATYASDLASEDLDSLAEWNLKGREIKDIVKNAHLICQYCHLNMSLDRLAEAIHVMTPFAGKVSPDPGA